MDKHLHIVCHDVPYPPDYGGVFDLFYKLKTLHEAGVKIHLHCFEYGRGQQKALEKYCETVAYYQRRRSLMQVFAGVPYIVSSRANKMLLKNLLQDEHPVLLEGIHCTFFLYTHQLRDKKTFVRLHNVEFTYYNQLAKNESNFFKKLFFLNESRLLKKYERRILSNGNCFSVSGNDIKTYQNNYRVNSIKYLPVFLPYISINSKVGKGEYCLYHGNLSINENEKVVCWLVEKVFSKLDIPLIIAGKNPSEKLKSVVEKNKNVILISSPTEEKMTDLISNAHINIIASFNSTGIKIKLLNALFNGRHCVVNAAAVEGTNLNSLCNKANQPIEFIEMIKQLMKKEFTEAEISKRETLLLKEFDNKINASQLMQWIY